MLYNCFPFAAVTDQRDNSFSKECHSTQLPPLPPPSVLLGSRPALVAELSMTTVQIHGVDTSVASASKARPLRHPPPPLTQLQIRILLGQSGVYVICILPLSIAFTNSISCEHDPSSTVSWDWNRNLVTVVPYLCRHWV